ncbi:hypothetical protein EB796_012213 [Bugula neritina]|uniref:Uncharacterized protein n=1 Tax=Bugula neritina TaxID=10212 RepID=A0A7J7JVZ9_BUGNE|nr:hypothetical protein EB796_012213 [Bugula neritina]
MRNDNGFHFLFVRIASISADLTMLPTLFSMKPVLLLCPVNSLRYLDQVEPFEFPEATFFCNLQLQQYELLWRPPALN